jgi:DNA polymerase (family 10)
MNAREVGQALDRFGVLLELAGENPFKVRAVSNAARLLEGVDVPLPEFLARARAGDVKGIGAGILDKIDALLADGTFPELDALREKFPPALLDLLRVPGLGAKKLKVLHEQLGIGSLGELEYACQENRLVALKGFGAKTQENVLAGIARIKTYSGRFLYPAARRAADALVASLAASGLASRIEVAGSLRRRMETVGDVDILATAARPAAVMDLFVAHPDVRQVTGHGATKSSVVLESGIAADLRVVAEDQFASALLHFTGSKDHNTELRGLARKLGFKVSEYGLFRGETPFPAATEEDLYRALGLRFIPPELREAGGEIERAAREDFPALVAAADLRGVLHVHSDYSDGTPTVAQWAEAVRAAGYAYLGISDHSRSAAYAGGLSVEAVSRQHAEIDALNRRLAPFRIFKGIESDILADGSLDYPPEVLASFDFVIASVHSGFRMTAEAMTARIVRAIENPYTTILGHPTGRLLLSREGYPVDMAEVLAAAAEHGVAIELNASPYRLDLDWRLHRRAAALGIPIAIAPDAHGLAGARDLEIGVGIARKGGLTAEDVLTCWETERVARYFARRRT